MKNIILKIRQKFRRILCLNFNIHKLQKGIAWSANYMRYDICYHCTYSRYIQDEIGSKLIEFQIQVHKEKRIVIIEKIKKKIDFFEQEQIEKEKNKEYIRKLSRIFNINSIQDNT